MTIDWEGKERGFRVTLRIMGAGFTPAEVEGMLGLRPDFMGLKGSVRRGRVTGRMSAPLETNMWFHPLPCERSMGFEEQILYLKQELGSRVQQLRRLSDREDVDCDLFAGYFGGPQADRISRDTLAFLAEAGLDWNVDKYPPFLVNDDDHDRSYRYCVALRILGKNLDPKEIEGLLGISSTWCNVPDLPPTRAAVGLWVYQIPFDEQVGFDNAIDELRKQLGDRHTGFRILRDARNMTCELFAGFLGRPANEWITCENLAFLSDAGLDWSLALYPRTAYQDYLHALHKP